MSHTTVTRLSAATALVAGAALFATAAEALPPGVAPPWANTTTTTETTTTTTPATLPSASIPAATAASPVEPSPAPDPTVTSTLPAEQPPGTGEPDTTSVQVTATPMQGATTPIHAVSLRAGPNTGAPVIGTLQPGMPLRILATANYGWMQVDSPVGSGWAYGSYLAPGGAMRP